MAAEIHTKVIRSPAAITSLNLLAALFLMRLKTLNIVRAIPEASHSLHEVPLCCALQLWYIGYFQLCCLLGELSPSTRSDASQRPLGCTLNEAIQSGKLN